MSSVVINYENLTGLLNNRSANRVQENQNQRAIDNQQERGEGMNNRLPYNRPNVGFNYDVFNPGPVQNNTGQLDQA